ncbi:glycosyltransferase [Lactococcus petauri]|nr:glycosyltransferase [Lactococcus petauri]
MEETLYIVVMIPAWNEAGSIGEAVSSIYEQTRLPDRIFVVPNNTTDLTI